MRHLIGIAVAMSAAAGAVAFTRERGPAAAPSDPTPAPYVAQVPVLDDAPVLTNPAPYIPAQCYAKTRRANGKPRNTCATCHKASTAPNFVNDEDVQLTLSIPRAAAENHWTNTLRNLPAVSIDDAAMLAYVRTDNYVDANVGPAIEGAQCSFAPDADGWDRDTRGRLTGWRAYAWAPTPGMFWPTNGSAGDAFIRLPEAYRRAADGTPSLEIYALNLALLESVIRRADVEIPRADEKALDVDLDGDGRLASAQRIKFEWPPSSTRKLHYVGAAATLNKDTAGWPAAGLFPVGTEIVHSVRYLDVIDGHVRPAARMKELRYMRKQRWLSYAEMDLAAKHEEREKEQNPDTLHHIYGDPAHGLGTGTGWIVQGFIEDATGALRSQTLEETAACIGCHGGVGATTDSTFSFARKVPGAKGWYTWGSRGFTELAEPKRSDGRGEYRAYLETAGAGDDFATNTEVMQRAFDGDGGLRPSFVQAFARDISVLVVPTPSRAVALDRGYLALVRSQAFAQGRDVLLGAPAIELRLVQGAPTGVQAPSD